MLEYAEWDRFGSPPDPTLFEVDFAWASSDFFKDSSNIPLSFSPELNSSAADPEPELEDEAVELEVPSSAADRKIVW